MKENICRSKADRSRLLKVIYTFVQKEDTKRLKVYWGKERERSSRRMIVKSALKTQGKGGGGIITAVAIKLGE